MYESKDRLAVCVYKEGSVVGHLPWNQALLLFFFLDRENNLSYAEETAMLLNHGAAMGMVVPYVFRLYGPESCVKRLNDQIRRNFKFARL